MKKTTKNNNNSTQRQNIMKMGNNKIRIMQNNIQTNIGQQQTRNTTK